MRDFHHKPGAPVLTAPALGQDSFLGAAIASSSRVYGLLFLMEKLGEDEVSAEDAQIISALAAQVGATYRGLRLGP